MNFKSILQEQTRSQQHVLTHDVLSNFDFKDLPSHKLRTAGISTLGDLYDYIGQGGRWAISGEDVYIKYKSYKSLVLAITNNIMYVEDRRGYRMINLTVNAQDPVKIL